MTLPGKQKEIEVAPGERRERQIDVEPMPDTPAPEPKRAPKRVPEKVPEKAPA